MFLFVRRYVIHEAPLTSLYAFIRNALRMCIFGYYDPRLYRQESSWSVLVPLPPEFVDEICMKGLDMLLTGSGYDSVYRSSLVKYAV